MSTRDPVLALAEGALATHGLAAVESARAELAKLSRGSQLPTNTLTWLVQRVSYHLRRAALRDALVAADWNLGEAARRLRVSGTVQLSRAIEELDLSDEFSAGRLAHPPKRGRS